MRDKLLLNPVEFETSDDVLQHLERSIDKWVSFGPLTNQDQFELSVGYEEVRITSDRHDYRLTVTLKNTGAIQLTKYWVNVTFPAAYLTTSTIFATEVAERRTPTHRFFRATQESHRREIFPGDSLLVFSLDYFVDHNLFMSGLNETVEVEANVPGVPARKIVRVIKELQKF